MRTSTIAALVSPLALLAPLASADVVFQTEGPFGGFFGLTGFDVFVQQSVAARFVPAADYELTSVGIWFMSNDGSGGAPAPVTVTLRTDTANAEYASVPSGEVLEAWTVQVPANGWNPVLLTSVSATHMRLNAGQRYWVVAESSAGPGVDPIWLWSAFGNEFTANTDGPGTQWESGSGAAITLIVQGLAVPACSNADYDGDGDFGTDADIEAFFRCLAGTCCATCWPGGADVNGDGDAGTDADIEAFFRVLAGGSC